MVREERYFSHNCKSSDDWEIHQSYIDNEQLLRERDDVYFYSRTQPIALCIEVTDMLFCEHVCCCFDKPTHAETTI